MLHDFDEQEVGGMQKATFDQFMTSELDFFLNHQAGKQVIATQYVGMPYENID